MQKALKQKGYAVSETGGGCTAYIKNRADGFSIYITAIGDPSAPEVMDEAVTVGVYDKEGTPVGTKDFDTLTYFMNVVDEDSFCLEMKGAELVYVPNGFESWHETHFEIVAAIAIEHQKSEPQGVVRERHDAQGHGGLYELAKELTDEFEQLNKGRTWDGEFFDEIEDFLNKKLRA
jgi:hypothetical protein